MNRPAYYCPICLEPYEPNGRYNGCPECVTSNKEATNPILVQASKKNAPYWDWRLKEDEVHRRSLYPDGDMIMADGSICHYDNWEEKTKLERINSVHAGKDFSHIVEI